MSLLYHPSKVLLLLDCFSTFDSLNYPKEGDHGRNDGGSTEIIAAGGAESFSLALCEALTVFGTEGTSFTAVDLYMRVLLRYASARQQPIWVRFCGAEEPSIYIVKQA
jgi:hypothetical protein